MRVGRCNCLEGHEDEADGETDADRNQQHEQTQVDTSLYSLGSATTVRRRIHRRRRTSRSRRQRGSANRMTAVRRQGASDVGVVSRRTNVRLRER